MFECIWTVKGIRDIAIRCFSFESVVDGVNSCMETLSRVQSLLNPGDACRAAIQCSLVDGDVRVPVLFTVVSHGDEQSVFLFDTSGLQNERVFLQRAIPITRNFGARLRKDSSRHFQTNLDMTVDLTTDEGHALSFELPSNTDSARFLEIIVAASTAQRASGISGSFQWLSQYKARRGGSAGVDPPVGTLVDFDAPASSSNLDEQKALEQLESTWEMGGEPGWPLSILGVGKKQSGDEWVTPIAKPEGVANLKVSSLSSTDTAVEKGLKHVRRLRQGSSYIGSRLKARETEYTDNKAHRVLCGTWNVNGQTSPESLYEWFEGSKEAPDILGIGFQELDLSAEAFFWGESSREDDWTRKVDISLQQAYRRNYYKLRSIRLVGMLLLVYVKEELKKDISDVQAEAQGTGILGMMGNKGGVAIRFNVHNTSICFVNSHLAAHTEEVERRNQDFHDICNKITFTESRSVLNHDILFWMGDLNYRLSPTSSTTESKFREMAISERFEELFLHDQLKAQMQLQNVFPGFSEAKIRFRPTYKYNPGTNEWDSSEKNRAPAWCDRVLWKGRGVHDREYRSHMELQTSDHKPVSAMFDVDIKVVDTGRKGAVLAELHLEMDKFENELKPVVKLNTLEFVFKDVKFCDKQVHELIIRNVGQSHADFMFKPPPHGDSICKSWVKVKPESGFISPESEERVTITVDIDKYSLSALNSGEEKLEDILVFHVENGADSFITVRGNFIPTCFGMSLEQLVGMHRFVRDVPVAKLIDHQDESVDSLSPFSVPKEVWLMVDYLSVNARETEDLFTQAGLKNEVGRVVSVLDTGMDTIKQSVHSVAEALLLFLEALPQPIIPYDYYQKCLECCNNFTLCKQLLTRIPTVHRDLFKYLAAFLRELLKHTHANKQTAKTLATIFGSVCIRAPHNQTVATRKKQQQQVNNKKAAFFYHFLVNEYDD
ncbi:inositol polyphosphate 5-phosphatase OCRL-like [Oscarella lobularis]|uniref:inositol polyphosphate 5-phosphatase OCRL-like n=1 Tax=Oscarella lobularis TaxID=121494 RepID=UPI003313590E